MHPPHRTRIKICGITRIGDALAAAEAGADAIGMVFYPQSPRSVAMQQAQAIARALPPFVSTVALFVNATEAEVNAVIDAVHPSLLQFHGDESPADCSRFAYPYLRAARMKTGLDLLDFKTRFTDAQALLLDTYIESYGGGGEVFDWSLIPKNANFPIVLSGGLHASNVGRAIAQVRPWAVDVSSGVELSKGVKDAAAIRRFIAAVRDADAAVQA
ncbi:MAG: phosphoribosylanthranilate isomerase [Thiomonas sp.]|uniref:phosphoribosylanthranilate isomerase n=1 Tax=mine drainage metagenome TaxID=410659 RepID=E6PW92_9ZZZZ